MVMSNNEYLWSIANELRVLGVSEVDLDGKVKRCNEAFARLVGRDHVSVIGSDIEDLTASDDVLGTLKRFQALRTGEVKSIVTEKRYVRPSGESVLARLECLAMSNEKGEITNLLSILSPLPDARPDEKIKVLEASLEDMRKLVAGLTAGVNVTMTGGNSVNADNGATASQDNSTTNSAKIMLAMIGAMALILISFIVLVVGGYLKIGSDQGNIEVGPKPAVVEQKEPS